MVKAMHVVATALMLGGCMDAGSGGGSPTVEEGIAAAFPDPADRVGIAAVIPRSDPAGLMVIFYPDDVSEAEMLARMNAFCIRRGHGAAAPGWVRAGTALIQDDGSTRESWRGAYSCV